MAINERPDFNKLASTPRSFQQADKKVLGPTTTIAITPVADGRIGAHEDNVERTWRMVEKVYDLITNNVTMPDGTPVRVVVAPEIVYGARTAARAQEYYATQGVSANIWVGRSWSYVDELCGAGQGIGSSEWQQCAYGLNQTDRPGAVWLKAFTACMDEKRRPIFCVYSPDLEDEEGPLNDYVSTRLLRFARAAAAVGYMRGKNYLSVRGVAMGIIGSDVRRNLFQQYLGMGVVSVDQCIINGRIDANYYDHDELKKALAWFENFNKTWLNKPETRRFALSDKALVEKCLKMTLICRDLLNGNPRLCDPKVAKKQGFECNVEYAQGVNAIVGGSQGQRQWADFNPNFDVTKSLLNSSCDWNGFRAPTPWATENDSKNGMGMLFGSLISGGAPQLFADIRTNWTCSSIKKATGVDVSKICPNGIIDKRNSGAAALEYGVDLWKLAKAKKDVSIQTLWKKYNADAKLQAALMKEIQKTTNYMNAALTYFPGDGLSSQFCTPGGIPMTSYRMNCVDNMLTFSIVEGESVELPKKVEQHIKTVTDPTWPETFWTPRDMTSFEYMNAIGPNHDGSSFGFIGADLVTLCAMLRIPVDMCNVPKEDIFRPTMWQRFGNDDFRACQFLGPLYM
ncbi:MAG: L-fucose isomerase [Lentisphaeria bacterium]|nr:L-fucose isomerase [Lentisphaeria bacterium]